MEGGAPGDRHGPGYGRRRMGMVEVEEGTQPRRGPDPDTGEGLPHRLRRRAAGRRSPARRHGAAARRGASRSGGRRLPPLRQPRRGAFQGEPRAARRARPGHAAPARPRTVRQAQRAGRTRGRLPVAPARSGRRDAPGGAVGRKGALPLGQGGSGEARWWATPPPEPRGRSASQKTCSGVTTSTSRGRAWASPP